MENLTSEIKRIIDLPLEEVNIEEAALLLLRVNTNQILYANLIRRNDVEKAVYELKKIYDFRVQDEALVETARMEKAVVKVLEEKPEINLPENPEESPKGIRADHDALPDEIKALFLENLNLLRRMHKLHEQLKLMNDKRPCDRYPYLKELLELDTQHRENWNKYDEFKTEPEQPKTETENPPMDEKKAEPEQADPKKVSAARKYLSDNKKKLSDLDEEKRAELLGKMQERYDYLIATNSGVSDEQKTEFKELGLNV